MLQLKGATGRSLLTGASSDGKVRHIFPCRQSRLFTVLQATNDAALAADFKGCESPLPAPIKVVGCGSCGVDYLASVLAFPKPDEKLRTETFEAQGGGNCANALTATARLGLSPVLLSKIGGDGIGDGIISELQADGVATEFILRGQDAPSPFTYIIVDRRGGTRTCIHTPGAALVPSDLDDVYLDTLLEGAALVYFDGRLTEAALKLADRAKQKQIQILVEAERLRPNLDRLLQYGDYVVTSAHFPQDWTGEKVLGDALLATAKRLPHASTIITTLGTRGSILLQKVPADVQGEYPEQPLDGIMQQLTEELEHSRASSRASDPPDCVSNSGISIRAQSIAQTNGYIQLGYSEDHDIEEAVKQARDAACRAASLNAGNFHGYALCPSMMSKNCTVTAKVTMSSIASLPQESVVDTTGAGDAFIGAVIYGICTGLPFETTLRLASVVAAAKCTALGARPGLPKRPQLSASLLGH